MLLILVLLLLIIILLILLLFIITLLISIIIVLVIILSSDIEANVRRPIYYLHSKGLRYRFIRLRRYYTTVTAIIVITGATAIQ